ncbi:MAG: alpha-ketoglutarate-dependent dioxygenase AlkB [Pseudomonadota bacterium]|nr:alpha-ketoglutarate-dependent dioxygenase AlkB [Pseudomonadota bacterium]
MAQEVLLLSRIDSQPWRADLKRWVQHYGWRYDYKERTVRSDAFLGPLPDWLRSLCHRLHDKGIFPSPPHQVIVNEYLPGQGISAHIDCIPCFGKAIASLSLGSACVMDFSNPETGQKKPVFLEQCSLVVLSGPARYEWQHRITARKSDIIGGIRTARRRRAFLTFRTAVRDSG